MKHKIIITTLGLLLAPFAAAEPVSAFTAFGGNATFLGNGVTVHSGLVGSNNAMTIGGASDTVSIMGAGILNGGNSIMASGNVTFNGNVSLGGSSHATGNINSGGNVDLGNSALVDGNVRAAGSVTLGGLAQVSGNVDAGKASGIAVTLGNNAKVLGTVTHLAGTTVSMGGGATVGANVIGPPAAPVPYVAATLNAATSFGAGLGDTTKGGGQITTLAAGAYHNFNLGSNNTLNLTSGNYYFNAFSLGGGSTIVFDLSGGAINLFFDSNVNIGNNLDVTLIGGDALDIYAETKGDWSQDGGGEWFGTVFGSGASSDVEFGNGSTLNGSFIARVILRIGGASNMTLAVENGVPGANVP
jgi:hypothetical protein